jgi:hypothetical protein
MLVRLVSELLRMLLLTHGRRPASRVSGDVPLDYVERLQRHGTSLPVVLELSRPGW